MGCAVPIGFILLLLGMLGVWQLRASNEIRVLETEITARGEPLTPEELHAAYRLPAGVRDKTDLFLHFFPQVEQREFTDSFDPFEPFPDRDDLTADRTKPWPQEAEAADFVRRHNDLIEEIKAAALAEGEVRFPINFEDGFTTLLPHVDPLRTAGRLLVLKALLDARQQDSEGAFQTVRARLAMSETMRHEPLLLCQLVSASIHDAGARLVCELLPETDWSNEQLQQLISELQSVDFHAGVKTAYSGERVSGRTLFTNPEMLGSEFALHSQLSTKEDERFFLDVMTQYVNAAELPFPAMLDELEQTNDDINDSMDDTHYLTLLSRIALPAGYAGASALAQAQVKTDAAAAHLAIELYRRKHGAYPKSLAELAPEFLSAVPIDPFDGTPLKYEVRETEIIVYSVSLNRTDEGASDDDEYELDDLVIRVRRK